MTIFNTLSYNNYDYYIPIVFIIILLSRSLLAYDPCQPSTASRRWPLRRSITGGLEISERVYDCMIRTQKVCKSLNNKSKCKRPHCRARSFLFRGRPEQCLRQECNFDTPSLSSTGNEYEIQLTNSFCNGNAVGQSCMTRKRFVHRSLQSSDVFGPGALQHKEQLIG